jgi:hypothetical protein
MRRDPAVTRIVHLPWKPQPCPCGSGVQYGGCCGIRGVAPYKVIASYKPPPLLTGYSHPGCYMNWTGDCSTTTSGEHFISRTVLSILNPQKLRIGGVSWLPKGQTKDLPLDALRANVLCGRHNSAWSGLDTMAGKFFRGVYGALALEDDPWLLPRSSLPAIPDAQSVPSDASQLPGHVDVGPSFVRIELSQSRPRRRLAESRRLPIVKRQVFTAAAASPYAV